MDATDIKILNIFQENSKIQNLALSKKIGLAPSATLERVRRLERKNIIQGYGVRLNWDELDSGFVAFVLVKVAVSNWDPTIYEPLLEMKNVLEVHEITGEYSYLLKVRVKDKDQLSEVVRQVGLVKLVRQTNSIVALKTVKDSICLDLPNIE